MSDLSADELEKVARACTPIGTIIASMLDESAFARVVGDPLAFDRVTSKWCLADGRDISGSIFARVKRVNQAPEARGNFLRGIDAVGRGVDADGVREPGSQQEDATKLPAANPISLSGSLFAGSGGGYHASGPHPNPVGAYPIPAHMSLVGGDAETRPKNIAVFFYLRINA